VQLRIWWIVGVVVYLVTLIANIPAALVMGWINPPATVNLGHASGTLWSGRFDTVQLIGVEFQDVKFSFEPLQLFKARLSVALASSLDSDSFVRGSLWLSPNHVGVSDFALQLPAQPVVNLIALPIPQTVAGLIRLDLSQASSGKPWCGQMQGTLGWDNALIHNQLLQQPLAMGPYSVELGCDQGEATAHVNDGGPLGVSADLRLVADGGYRISALISPSPEVPAEVRQGLALIGEDHGAGYQVEFNGSFK